MLIGAILTITPMVAVPLLREVALKLISNLMVYMYMQWCMPRGFHIFIHVHSTCIHIIVQSL